MVTNEDKAIQGIQGILLWMALRELKARIELKRLDNKVSSSHRCLICNRLTIDYHDHEVK